VLLAAIVTIDWPRKVAWELTWSWERPDEPAFCQLKNWNTPLSVDDGKRMMAALNAFRQEILGRGRRPGSGARFETKEDLEQAILAAAVALIKRSRKVTKESVGRYLVAQGPRNMTERWHAGDGPADPARQLRAWCDQFEVNFEGLISGL
jgi:hypothetical protein